VAAKEDTVIGGKYEVKAGEPIAALLAKMHLDPVVYGDDANEWKPERMLDENFDRLSKEFPNSWKPFGNGMRACIGRPFAWQESLIVVAILLQNFNFVAADPNYKLHMKQTLTIKPKDFYMRAILRNQVTPTTLEHSLQSTTSVSLKDSAKATPTKAAVSNGTESEGKPFSIFYGSNTGTCEALAQRLASDAVGHGFLAKTIDSLDSANQNVPPEGPVVIITASYEGQPPDNAAHFVDWLESLDGNEMSKVSYAVFGCGHHDWATTFHRIPKLVDRLIEERGGTRIASMGLTDVASGDMFTDFETWEDQVLWPAMAKKYGVTESDSGDTFQAGINVEVSTPRCSTLRQDVKEAHVVNVKTLSAPDVPAKKHIEIKLPSDAAYSAGDYLALLPINPKDNVARAMRYFSLPWDSHLTISTTAPTSLPTNVSIPASDVLGAYVELAQPATKRNITALAEATKDEKTKEALQKLVGENYATEISSKRVSVLDLLEKYPTVGLPIGSFLAMLPPMRVRQYSISSSPLWNAHNVTLTYAVLDQPSLSGQGRHVGVASNYLSSLTPGDTLHVAVRPSSSAFHLPTDGENIPVIMIAAGSGLAPFRGFIQERGAQVGAGRNLAPAVLFFGCRKPDSDDLYADEFKKWEAMGAIRVLRAYSQDSDKSAGCKYVQDRVWAERDEVMELWDKGAKVFICGSKDVGEGVKETCLKIFMETVKEKEIKEKGSSEMSRERAEKWFEGIRNERFATDVFA
jgi:cytochrome P450/NADPH-cytochrome P450 reductase